MKKPLERISGKENSSQSYATAKLPETPANAIESYDIDGAKAAIVPGRYILLEPEMPRDFENVLRDVILYFSFSKSGNPEERLMKAFLRVVGKRKIAPEEARKYWYHIYNSAFKAGRITPLLSDQNIEDIACSGPNKPVYVYHRKYGYIPTNLILSGEELNNFIHALVQKTGMTLSLDNPIVDATLYDGSRLNTTISISKEPSFVIRKIRRVPLTPKALIDSGTWSPEIAALLWLAVESRCSLMFIGATASGKTTAMNAAAFFIPMNSRIVSIEDTFEIWLPHENWTAMITKGSITQLDLLKAALRQRPEYIIVGEARGVEVREMFTAMGTGHTTLTTFHGSDVASVLRRLSGETLGIKQDQLMLLDFIVTLAFVEGRRICTSVTAISGEGDERLLGQVYGTEVVRYLPEERRHEIKGIDAAIERMGQKSFLSSGILSKKFEERLLAIKNAPSDYPSFVKFIAQFGVENER